MTDETSGESPRGPAPEQNLLDELERLRERVAFYESFDQLIHENIARSGDLLRQSMELRENATRELAEAKAEAERFDNSRYQATLSDLLAEVTTLQSNVERLGRRVSDAIEELESELSPGEEFSPPPRLPGGETIKADFLSTPPEYITFTTPEERAAATSSEPEDRQSVPEVELSSPELFEPVETPSEPEPGVVHPDVSSTSGPEISGEIAASAEAMASAPPVTEPELPAAEEGGAQQSMTLLVHGVPRAATALSLQRYLAQLGQVEAVEPREYAGGVLRLHVAVREPVSVDDLRGWKEGAGFEPVHTRHDLIEVRLPGASGF
jgi:hypothetical protein